MHGARGFKVYSNSICMLQNLTSVKNIYFRKVVSECTVAKSIAYEVGILWVLLLSIMRYGSPLFMFFQSEKVFGNSDHQLHRLPVL